MNTAIIYRLLSMVLVALAAAFAVCGGAGLLSGETISDRAPRAFALSILITLFLAAVAYWLARQGTAKLFRREALCTIGLSWILATLVGAIPYILIVKDCSIADAIFESCSGITTTGATAFPEFHEFPKSLLYWRSLSQWIGGLGVVVFFVAILSSLGAGAKILFSNESSARSSDFEEGRVQRGAFHLMLYYFGLTLACLFAYRLGGMNWFQAINHAMTTVATGGFSTEPLSIGQFNSPLIEYTTIIFMILAGTNFTLLYLVLLRRAGKIFQDVEFRTYLGIILVVTSAVIFFGMRADDGGFDSFGNSARYGLFQVVSILTTTGYGTADFNGWNNFGRGILLLLMFVGGCAGSTGGGMKVIRHILFYKILRLEIEKAHRRQRQLTDGGDQDHQQRPGAAPTEEVQPTGVCGLQRFRR